MISPAKLDKLPAEVVNLVQELYTDTVKQALKEDADIYRIAAAMGKLPDDTGQR